MEVNGQLNDLASFPPDKRPTNPIGWEAGWASEPVWIWQQREKVHFLPLLLIRPQSSSLWPCRYT